jgi:hypothetical protein
LYREEYMKKGIQKLGACYTIYFNYHRILPNSTFLVSVVEFSVSNSCDIFRLFTSLYNPLTQTYALSEENSSNKSSRFTPWSVQMSPSKLMRYGCNTDSLKVCYNGWFTILLLWWVYPLLGNDSVNAFRLEQTLSTTGHPLICNGAVNTPKIIRYNRRRCFPGGPPPDYITTRSNGVVSFYQKLRRFIWRRVHLRVVENWFELLWWKLEVTEKYWQEINQIAKIRFQVWFEETDCYKSVAGIWLVKTENPSAYVTVNCDVCRSAIALYCL